MSNQLDYCRFLKQWEIVKLKLFCPVIFLHIYKKGWKSMSRMLHYKISFSVMLTSLVKFGSVCQIVFHVVWFQFLSNTLWYLSNLFHWKWWAIAKLRLLCPASFLPLKQKGWKIIAQNPTLQNFSHSVLPTSYNKLECLSHIFLWI